MFNILNTNYVYNLLTEVRDTEEVDIAGGLFSEGYNLEGYCSGVSPEEYCLDTVVCA